MRLGWTTPQQFHGKPSTTNILTSSGTSVFQNIDLLAELDALGETLGCTVMRTHMRLTPLNAPNLGDQLNFGLIIGRSADAGVAVAGSVTPNQIDLDWMLWDQAIFNGGFSQGGGNVIQIDNRSKRKMEELHQAYIFSTQAINGVANQWHVLARVLIALP